MKSAAAAAADEDVSGGNDTPVADVARAVVALSPAWRPDWHSMLG